MKPARIGCSGARVPGFFLLLLVQIGVDVGTDDDRKGRPMVEGTGERGTVRSGVYRPIEGYGGVGAVNVIDDGETISDGEGKVRATGFPPLLAVVVGSFQE